MRPTKRRWAGETVVIAASGPSLNDQDMALVRKAHARRDCRVIAVNNSWEKAPFADVLYAHDPRWWQEYAPDFAGERWSQCEEAESLGVNRFVPEPDELVFGAHNIQLGSNSGYQALRMAVNWGADRIVLTGFDMQARGAQRHWHADHDAPGFSNPSAQNFEGWLKGFEAAAGVLRDRGVTVLNATRETAITCFKRQRMAACLTEPIEDVDRPVFIVGGGPSAKALELSRLEGAGTVIAINDGFKLLPFAEYAFTADSGWLSTRADALREFRGAVVAGLYPGATVPYVGGLNRLELKQGVGISDYPGEVFFADNSGFAALNWAVANGCRRIALIGFDFNPEGGHWHGGYEWISRMGPELYPYWVKSFERVAPAYAERGARIVNLNPDSRLRCFDFAAFDDALTGIAWASDTALR